MRGAFYLPTNTNLTLLRDTLISCACLHYIRFLGRIMAFCNKPNFVPVVGDPLQQNTSSFISQELISRHWGRSWLTCRLT